MSGNRKGDTGKEYSRSLAPSIFKRKKQIEQSAKIPRRSNTRDGLICFFERKITPQPSIAQKR